MTALNIAQPTLRLILLADLHESPWNTRRHYDDAKLDELGASLRQRQLTPCIVRPRPAGGYEIGAGHRRRRAAERAGVPSLLCLVREMGDGEFLELLITENGQREDVHPLDEALGYERLLDLPGYDVASVAEKFGRSPSYVYGRLHLVHLVPEAQEEFFADQFPLSHALVISRLAPDAQLRALGRVHVGWNQELVVPIAEFRDRIAEECHADLKSAAWKLDDAELVPSAGACLTCPQRTGTLPDLFADIKGENICTDRSCYTKKHAAHIERTVEAAADAGEELVRLSGRYNDRAPKPGRPVPANMWRPAKKSTMGSIRGIDLDSGKTRYVTLDIPKQPTGRTQKKSNGPETRVPDADEQCELNELAVRRAIAQALMAAAFSHDDTPDFAAFLRLGRACIEVQADCSETSSGINPYNTLHCEALNDMMGWDLDGEDWWKSGGERAPILRGKVRAALSDGSGLPMVTAMLLVDESLEVLVDRNPGEICEHPYMTLAAEVFGVDIGAIRRGIEAERTPKEPEASAPAPAVRKKGKTKPAKSNDDFHPGTDPCEVCGCTAERACPEGCSWDPKFLAQDRAVCSQCAALVRKEEGT